MTSSVNLARRTDSLRQSTNTLPTDVGVNCYLSLFKDAHANYLQCLEKMAVDLTGFKDAYESIATILDTLGNLYNSNIMDGVSENGEPDRKWKEYRLEDCIKVCAQEADRIFRCLECNPSKTEIGTKSVMELEQQLGIWTPYLSDDTDDEDWTPETGTQRWGEPSQESEEEDYEVPRRKKRVISLSDEDSSDEDIECV